MQFPVSRARSDRLAACVAVAVAAVLLAGCERSLGSQDFVSPRADAQVTRLVMPGGAILAPILSTSQGSATTGAVSAEFPNVGVEITVFNGVSVSLTAFRVAYAREDGDSFGLQQFGGALAEFIPASFDLDAPTPSSRTITIQVVSGELRSFLAGPDGRLGSDDDFRSNVAGTIAIFGRDINGNDVSIPARLTITARPESPGSI